MSDQTERAAFEAWAATQPRHEGVDMRFLALNNAYIDFDLHGAWNSWQAARAAQPAAEPVALELLREYVVLDDKHFPSAAPHEWMAWNDKVRAILAAPPATHPTPAAVAAYSCEREANGSGLCPRWCGRQDRCFRASQVIGWLDPGAGFQDVCSDEQKQYWIRAKHTVHEPERYSVPLYAHLRQPPLIAAHEAKRP